MYDPNGNEAIGATLSVCYYLVFAWLAVCALIAIENETHFLSKSLTILSQSLEDINKKMEEFFISFVTTLYNDNQYGTTEKHHIVARKDPRALISRVILDYANIGIEDERNKVDMKKEYHKVLHTDLYYGILNLSMFFGYISNGSQGVEGVLSFFKNILGAL